MALPLAVVLACLCNAAQSLSPLDGGFTTWLRTGTESKEIRYEEIAARFLEAAGRDARPYRERIAALEREARAYLASKDNPESPEKRCALLAKFLFDECGFVADRDLLSAQNLFPDAILERRRGYCLGLTLIILDLGERLGWPLAAGAAPRHVFVRYRSSPTINFETTMHGEAHSDDWYRHPFGEYSAALDTAIRTLTPRELGAHLINNHGYLLLEQGVIASAEEEFRASLSLFPDLVEATMNRGVAHARERRFTDALASFDAVLAAWKDDPYARLNRAGALGSAGRAKDAVAEVSALVATHPRLPELAPSITLVRDALDEVNAWQEVQALSLILNGVRIAERGTAAGITGRYYRDKEFQQLVKTRVDADLSFRWSWDAAISGGPRDHFAVRWDGLLEIAATGEYTIFVTCSDGVRVFVDGRLVVDSWLQANNNLTSGEVSLIQGLHELRVDYFEYHGEAGIKVILTAKSAKYPLPLAPLLKHFPEAAKER